jgi:hypothetical protein
MSTIRLVQLHKGDERRVALVEEPELRLLDFRTMYELLGAAMSGQISIHTIPSQPPRVQLEYDSIYSGESEWKLLPPIDHPESARCLISGTGLTHLGSAKNRDAMHEKASADDEKSMTDSMKIFRWGVEGGKPAKGEFGIAPEWFYKGTGSMLRGHNQPIDQPSHAEDGGEEAEIAGVYVIDQGGRPVRIGMTQGNEFSDHVFEKKNYLNLAGSKLRQCSIGPELVINPDFSNVPGHTRINRMGETEMCHSLANIEHHHFKFEGHRRPGDVHIHFFGACALSFGDGIRLQDGDIMQVQFKGFGRALRNPLRVAAEPCELVTVTPLM